MTEPAAYRSSLTLAFGPPRPPGNPRPSDVTDAEDPELLVWRRDVVDPVVAALLSPEEVDRVSVHRGVDGGPGDVWVRVVAVGEVFEDWLFDPAWCGDDDRPGDPHVAWTPARCAARCADHLQDFVAESAFGWGQRRPLPQHLLPQG